MRQCKHQFHLLVRVVNLNLGVLGRPENVTTYGAEEWVWRAAPGTVLRWAGGPAEDLKSGYFAAFCMDLREPDFSFIYGDERVRFVCPRVQINGGRKMRIKWTKVGWSEY